MSIAKFALVTLSLAMICVGCDEPKNIDTETPETEVSLDSMIKASPDNVELLVKRGREKVNAYLYDDAMVDAAKAYRLDSANFDVRLLYAKVLNNRSTRTVDDIYAAQKQYNQLVQEQPKNLEALVGLAATYSQFQDFENSFKYINDALRIDQTYRDAYVLKGSNYAALNKPDLVKSSYQTAIQQDPKFYEAYIALGSIYQQEGSKLCVEYFTTAYQLQPEDPNAKYSVAFAKQHFGQIPEAQDLYREMEQDTSDFFGSRALFQQGHIHQFALGDIDSAIYFYAESIKRDPRYVESFHNLGMCYDKKGKRDQALKFFGKALKHNPEFTLSREYADSIKRLM